MQSFIEEEFSWDIDQIIDHSEIINKYNEEHPKAESEDDDDDDDVCDCCDHREDCKMVFPNDTEETKEAAAKECKEDKQGKAETKYLDPAQLAKELGYPNADLMNKALQRAGLQQSMGGTWFPTEAGKLVSKLALGVKEGRLLRSIVWDVAKLKIVLEAIR